MISTTTSAEFIHKSVLGEEAPEALVTDPDGLYVDATFGRGGHTRRILAKLSPKGRVIAFDRDPEAVKAAAALTDALYPAKIFRPRSPDGTSSVLVNENSLRAEFSG